MGGASVVDAHHCTVLTCNGTELAAFIADAANAFATDEDVFTAANNNQDKIGVLTVQRDEARAQLAAAQQRIAELEAAIVWALGYTDFRPREEGEGTYYWRAELRKRANMTQEQIDKALASGAS
jgi:hypothetical protein